MKQQIRKWTALFLSIVMMISVMPLDVLADVMASSWVDPVSGKNLKSLKPTTIPIPTQCSCMSGRACKKATYIIWDPVLQAPTAQSPQYVSKGTQ